MKKIVGAVLLTTFFIMNACAGNVQKIAVESMVKTTKSWDGETLPAYPLGQPEITVLRIKIPPGGQIDWHRHPVINAGVLVTGELTVITEDNKMLHLKAGDSIVEVVNKNHYGKNDGPETAEIIVFYAGIENMPITIK